MSKKTTDLSNLKLSPGSHSSIEDGACITEFCSYIAGEPWSDHPHCVSPAVTEFCIFINDNGSQKHRDRLFELAPKIIKTKDFKKEPMRATIYAKFSKRWVEKYVAEYYRLADEFSNSDPLYAVYSAQFLARSSYFWFNRKLFDESIETLEEVLAI